MEQTSKAASFLNSPLFHGFRGMVKKDLIENMGCFYIFSIIKLPFQNNYLHSYYTQTLSLAS